MKFLFNIGDDVDIVASGRVIERTETQYGNRYFVQLDSGRKIGVSEDDLVAAEAGLDSEFVEVANG